MARNRYRNAVAGPNHHRASVENYGIIQCIFVFAICDNRWPDSFYRLLGLRTSFSTIWAGLLSSTVGRGGAFLPVPQIYPINCRTGWPCCAAGSGDELRDRLYAGPTGLQASGAGWGLRHRRSSGKHHRFRELRWLRALFWTGMIPAYFRSVAGWRHSTVAEAAAIVAASAHDTGDI
jgi:hypothetical protein